MSWSWPSPSMVLGSNMIADATGPVPITMVGGQAEGSKAIEKVQGPGGALTIIGWSVQEV